MSLYTISDLHLSFGTNKPMNVFYGWDNYTERIFANWNRIVSPEDTVVIPGDISWGLKLNETTSDFAFIDKLNGKKIIAKGNHDYWWSTFKKIKEFLNENDFSSIEILFNNAYLVDGISVCGTRGWLYDGTSERDEKVIMRECGRLEQSIKKGIELGGKPVVFLHYPFAYGEFVCEEILDVLKRYNITDVFYGHIHGSGLNKSLKEFEGIKMHLVSCDCTDFSPISVTALLKNR